MDDHIAKYGWGDWSHGCASAQDGGANCLTNSSCWCQNVTYVEFGSSGPGASPTTRVKWSHQLTSDAEPLRGRLGLAGTQPQKVMGQWVPEFESPRPADSEWPPPMLPRWEPTWNMSLSTVMQPCNDSGFLEPTFASKFGIVDIVSQPNHVPDVSVIDRSFVVSEQDWANAKRLWSNHQPMDSEALMVEQASQLRRLNPQSKPWVCESHLSVSCCSSQIT